MRAADGCVSFSLELSDGQGSGNASVQNRSKTAPFKIKCIFFTCFKLRLNKKQVRVLIKNNQFMICNPTLKAFIYLLTYF